MNRSNIGVIVTAGMLTAGCAGMGTYDTVAPLYVGHPIERMALDFGAPERVVEAGNLTFYEWRIGEVATEPDRITGTTSGGSISGRVERGSTKFLGCIVKATVDQGGTIIGVTTESKTGSVGNVYEFYGCGKIINNPFAAQITPTEQDLNLASNLSIGMSQDEVRQVMGEPAKTELNNGIEEWHFCKTGRTTVDFVALFFHRGELFSTKSYTVTLQDTGGVTGDCSIFIKQGSYQEPDAVTELRSH